jgi:hypothetical protein
MALSQHNFKIKRFGLSKAKGNGFEGFGRIAKEQQNISDSRCRIKIQNESSSDRNPKKLPQETFDEQGRNGRNCFQKDAKFTRKKKHGGFQKGVKV